MRLRKVPVNSVRAFFRMTDFLLIFSTVLFAAGLVAWPISYVLLKRNNAINGIFEYAVLKGSLYPFKIRKIRKKRNVFPSYVKRLVVIEWVLSYSFIVAALLLFIASIFHG